MAKLSQDQLSFLAKHDIPLSRVFDASNLPVSAWRQAMKDLEMWVAFGGAKCAASGHQLRTRNSDCVQCKPERIGYLKRYLEPGDVYIAASRSKGILKVGMAKDVTFRVTQLRSYEYGGARDWTLQRSITCKFAGKVELETHRILAPYLHQGTYYKDGDDRECRELFKCSEEVALAAIQAAAKVHDK